MSELLEWKRGQVAGAGEGTQISDAEARRFARLSEEERQAVAQVARLAQRVLAVAQRAQRSLADVDAAFRGATRQAQLATGPAYEVGDDGKRTDISGRLELPEVEQRVFRASRAETLAAARAATEAAVEMLSEELAVLRMISGEGLASATRQVEIVARGLADMLGDDGLVEVQQAALDAGLSGLWSVANGADPPTEGLRGTS